MLKFLFVPVVLVMLIESSSQAVTDVHVEQPVNDLRAIGNFTRFAVAVDEFPIFPQIPIISDSQDSVSLELTVKPLFKIVQTSTD
jgi:hypothetical protein